MRISIGCDHRGVPLKTALTGLLARLGHEVQDEGTCNQHEPIDYPDIAAAVSQKVSRKDVERGLLVCGSGIGMAITANKFPGVRATVCQDEKTAEICRRHNDVNVLCFSNEMLSEPAVERMVEIWLSTPFEGGRHARRLEKIAGVERSSCESLADGP